MICQVKIIILAWPSVPTYSGTVLVLLINDQGEKEKGRDEPHAKPEKRGFGEVALLALRNETIYAVTDYWLDVNRLDYLLPSGTRGVCALNDLNLVRTTQLNSERGVLATFSDVPPSRQRCKSTTRTNT